MLHIILCSTFDNIIECLPELIDLYVLSLENKSHKLDVDSRHAYNNSNLAGRIHSTYRIN